MRQKFSRSLKDLRLQLCASQQQLAEILCVSRQTVVRWEQGLTIPSNQEMKEIIEFLKLEIKRRAKERNNTSINFSNKKRNMLIGLIVCLITMLLSSLFFIEGHKQEDLFFLEEVNQNHILLNTSTKDIKNKEYIVQVAVLTNKYYESISVEKCTNTINDFYNSDLVIKSKRIKNSSIEFYHFSKQVSGYVYILELSFISESFDTLNRCNIYDLIFSFDNTKVKFITNSIIYLNQDTSQQTNPLTYTKFDLKQKGNNGFIFKYEYDKSISQDYEVLNIIWIENKFFSIDNMTTIETQIKKNINEGIIFEDENIYLCKSFFFMINVVNNVTEEQNSYYFHEQFISNLNFSKPLDLNYFINGSKI